MKEQLINMTTRAAPELHKWFEDKAKKEKRSIASLMLIAMEEYYIKNQEK